ncbi:MAG: energy-coupling factor transporter ATPase [Peptococcaceae bacterium]|nr:energy-coupling factor transporter ATPase [Peptococcaceae bacterium]
MVNTCKPEEQTSDEYSRGKEIFIRVKNLTYIYNSGSSREQTALKNVDLDIYKGEFLALVGANASGKSTLARHFNALLMPTVGTVTVDGMDTAKAEYLWDIRRRVGMVFQNPDNQIVSSLVEEDVAFGVENLGLPSGQVRARVEEALSLTGLSEFRQHAPNMLSGGQKQRLAIAGVLAMQPDCLVLDEPSSMLDPAGRRELTEIILDLNRSKGVTVILATHYMEEAALAHRVQVMNAGEILLSGTPAEVFRDEKLVQSVGLELPFTAKIAHRLRRRGILLPEGIVDLKDLVSYLCR